MIRIMHAGDAVLVWTALVVNYRIKIVITCRLKSRKLGKTGFTFFP
jgi:hypothetical protein